MGKPRYKRARRRISVLPQAESYEPLAGLKNPHPGPPPREGALSDAIYEPLAFCRMQTTNYKLQATNRMPIFCLPLGGGGGEAAGGGCLPGGGVLGVGGGWGVIGTREATHFGVPTGHELQATSRF